MDITIGETYATPYPFVRREVELPPDSPDATGMATTMSWVPGVEREHYHHESDADAYADGLGEMLMTVIDVHKPGRFPARVFYTRQWKDPSGHVFGKAGLRIVTAEKFRRLRKGYQHEFDLRASQHQEPHP